MDRFDDAIFERVEKLLQPLILGKEDYENIRDKALDAMNRGLQLKSREASSIKMYPSFVTRLPTGKEKGQFLALDLGGTNYRVILVTLSGEGERPKIDERTYSIPEESMHGTSKDLFEYIASTLQHFLQRYGVENKTIPLGFTFSFPCEQRALNQSVLVRWTKGFDVPDAVNSDICKLLQDAFDNLVSLDLSQFPFLCLIVLSYISNFRI